MSKIYMDITLRVIADTDLTNPYEIVENLDIDVTPNTENVEVYDTEIANFNIWDTDGNDVTLPTSVEAFSMPMTDDDTDYFGEYVNEVEARVS